MAIEIDEAQQPGMENGVEMEIETEHRMHSLAEGQETNDAGGENNSHNHTMDNRNMKSHKIENHHILTSSNIPHKAHRGRHEGHKTEDFKRRFIISMILTIPILLLSPFIQDIFRFKLELSNSEYAIFLLSSIVYFYGGYPFLKGFSSEVKDKNIGMMTLIAIAISVAYFYSSAVVFGLDGEVFFWELATLIDIMLLGHWIEMRSVLGASKALEELVRIMPSDAHLIKENGEIVDIKVETLRPGDRVQVLPGEKIPIDGRVLGGETSVNESMLTGESRPVAKREWDGVIGGSINGEGSISVEVMKVGSETYLNQIIDLVRVAQESKSKAQNLADYAARWLTIIALAAGAITFAAWLHFSNDSAFAVERAVTVMVISCPHALGLAVPLVVAVSTSMAARSGLLIRDRSAFEGAREIGAVVFDKTGTLTEGRSGVTDVVALAGLDQTEVLRMVASLEANSEHHIAAGVLSASREKGLDLIPVHEFRAIPGKGVTGQVEGRSWMVVGPGYLRENNIGLKDDQLNKLAEEGKTVVFLLEENKPIGAIALADIVRKESREAINRLKSMNIKCMMLTGDNRFVARSVAEELGLDDFFAEVLPHEKAQVIKDVQKEYIAAMVGDGVNDAPALVQADVGVAIGAGTDVAVESADIVLVRNDPRDVANIISLSKKTYAKMLQNLIWATGYNALAIPLAAGILYSQGILLSPAVGAILMSASTVIVAVNARLMKM